MTGKTDKTPAWIKVPAKSDPVKCRGENCGRMCYWDMSGRIRILVDCTVAGGQAPTRREEGRGFNHMYTCPDADTFRKSRRATKPEDSRVDAQGDLLL